MFLCACGGKAEISPEEKAYYKDLQQFEKTLHSVQRLTESNSFLRQRYEEKLREVSLPARQFFEKYKGSPQITQKDSYKSALDSYKSYLLAAKIWQDNKGMALVNQHFADAELELKRIPSHVETETLPVEEKDTE